MPILSIRDEKEFATIVNSAKPVVVDFHADCRLASRAFSELSNTFIGVSFYRVNVDNLEDVALEADVRVLPTYMVYKDGKIMGQTAGIDSRNLHAMIRLHGAL
ncbi:thioredoxin-like protein [Hygrophoropsis aurantiaca]|uniref:Thioredoxin-like protein n=1 Tax=Hygrophoropsis aurantiaca TaxID=72124 RepID=A0ACB8AQX2_9AGAM|nr:thioredoxin-like protein [Hygrophoropsis aurantiaca]